MVIRCLTKHDIPTVVSVHITSFEKYFLTALGPHFLRQYYHCVFTYPQKIALGAFINRKMVGFVSGFINPPAFYSKLHSNRIKFALAALPGLIRRPNHIIRILVNYRRSKGIAKRKKDFSKVAELSSLAVARDFRKVGIGTELVQYFCAEAKKLGATSVVLTTDTHNNKKGNRFYQKLGFELNRTFEAQPGRYLNEYHMKLFQHEINEKG